MTDDLMDTETPLATQVDATASNDADGAIPEGYLERARYWYRFQQNLGHNWSSMLGLGLKRVALTGLAPTPPAPPKKSKKAKGNTALPHNSRNAITDAYERWIIDVEQEHKLATLPTSGPLISVIVPVYNPPIDLLVDCIESVLNQSYQNWQLVLVDDCSTDPEVREALTLFSAAEPQIDAVFLDQNQHISMASQAGVNAAHGEFIALLDHDDLLAVRALARVAQEIGRHPQARYFYSDEDKINATGQRYEPHFKSGWNPQLLLGQNYICHLSVIQRQLFNEAGGFRPGYDGSQDHDLALRCTRLLQQDQIQHIPEVLYHWRAIAGSTAHTAAAKDYTNTAGMAAVQDYVDEHHPGAEVVPANVPNAYRVKYMLPTNQPKVCLIMPTRDQKALTEQAINSIIKLTNYSNYEILLVDNGSIEPDAIAYFNELRGHARISVLEYNQPFNYSAINNFAVEQTDAEVIGLINNDIEVISPDWLEEMAALAIQPGNGCIGAKLYYPEDRIQHAGVILGVGGVAGHSHKYYERGNPGYFSRLCLTQNLAAVTGACLLVRRDVFNEVGGLEEQALQVAFNDVDFCLRVLRAGYLNVWTPFAELYHHESMSRGQEDSEEKITRFNAEADWMREQWGSLLQDDPYYSPNLTLEHEDFSIRLMD